MRSVDSGLFIGWVLGIMAACFALSLALHVALGRVGVWSVVATAVVPPIIAIGSELGLPPHSSDLWSLGAYMAAAGSIAGLICASVGAWLGVTVRRFVTAFLE
jgi:hypothetical protein